MDNQFQVVIHRISTDTKFRDRFLSDFNTSLSPFSLSDEEKAVLWGMRNSFLLTDASPQGVAEPDFGPFGWHGAQAPQGVAEPDFGPFGWHGIELPDTV